MERGIKAVDKGIYIAYVGRIVNIPLSNFHDHFFGQTLSKKRGPMTVLISEEEKQIAEYIKKMQNLGHPLTLLQL